MEYKQDFVVNFFIIYLSEIIVIMQRDKKCSLNQKLKSVQNILRRMKLLCLSDGLIETIVEHIRHLHQKLSMDALELSSSKKKKVKVLLLLDRNGGLHLNL